MIRYKKAKLLDSQVEDLIQNSESQNFWKYLNCMKDKEPSLSGNIDVLADSLFNHFKGLHSNPDLSYLPQEQISLKCDISKLEEIKDSHNYLDNPISIDEIDSMIKRLKSKKAPGPDKISNEMLKAGIHVLKTALCKLFNLILRSGFSLALGAKEQ